MGMIGGGLFLIAILAGIFITPFVLGAYVVVDNGPPRVMSTYFAFVTAVFVVLVIIGLAATVALMAA